MAASDGLTFIPCLLATGSRCASAVLLRLPDHRLLIEAVDLVDQLVGEDLVDVPGALDEALLPVERFQPGPRSEEHTSELQSLAYLVCRLLLEKKKKHQ